jgi:hypothetical protein
MCMGRWTSCASSVDGRSGLAAGDGYVAKRMRFEMQPEDFSPEHLGGKVTRDDGAQAMIRPRA